MEITKIAIVDDHELFRMGIRAILGSNAHYQIVGEFSDTKVLQQIPVINPLLIICDLSLGKESGIQLIRNVKINYPAIFILVMSMHRDEFHVLHALENGADGYLCKTDRPEEILKAIHKILSGEKYYSEQIAEVINTSKTNNPSQSSKLFLTKKEKEVIHFIMEGLTSKQISDRLNVSSRTIETHRYNILTKLGLRSTTELVKMIADQNLSF